MTSTRWITCKEFIEFVWAYLSGEVSDAERREFEYHLSGCPSCVAYMNTYKQTIDLTRMAFEEASAEEPVPDEVPEELIRAVLAARKAPGQQT
jgi:anti-sigma factor RsiW